MEDFAFDLPVSAFSNQLQSTGVLVHGEIYPRTALVVLNDSSHLAVDAVYFTNKLLPAVIPGNFLDALRDTVNLSL